MRIAKILLISILAAAPALPVQAQSADERSTEPLSESLERVFRDLMDEMRPAIDGLSETLETLERIDSLEHYQRPEILPNGDIIIRRREDAPPLDLPEGEGPGIRT